MQSPQTQATVVFAEGDPTLRAAVAEKLSSRRSLMLAGVAKTLPELVKLVGESWPDVVILGRNLPGVSQAGVVRRISAMRPQMPILLMTQTGSAHTGVAEALREGARVALRYDCSPLQIASAVSRVCAGEWGPQDAANRENLPLPLLTRREVAVLSAIVLGRSDEDACGELGMTPRTFLTHVRHLYTKLDAVDRAGLVARARALQRRYLLDGTETPQS